MIDFDEPLFDSHEDQRRGALDDIVGLLDLPNEETQFAVHADNELSEARSTPVVTSQVSRAEYRISRTTNRALRQGRIFRGRNPAITRR